MVILLCLVEVETVFFHALPYPLCFFPLVFSFGLYLYQYLGFGLSLWWLPGLGFFLDYWHIGLAPAETIFYSLTAGVVFFLSRHFFSNRSFYGINLCVFLAILALHFFHALYFFTISLKTAADFPWLAFGQFIFWQGGLAIFMVSILFLTGRRLTHWFSLFLSTGQNW